MWGCQRHWYILPKALRSKIWAACVPGQEITKTPSAEYVEVAREVQRWIDDRYPVLLWRPSGTRVAGPETAEQLRLLDAARALLPRVGVVLAGWGLVMGGEMSLARWQPTVQEALRVRYGANERTAAKVIVEVGWLHGVLAAGRAHRQQREMAARAPRGRPPRAVVELAHDEVLEVHGVNPGLFSASATVAREAWRQVLHGVVAPLGRLAAEELSLKLGVAVAFTWSELRAADIMSRARAVGSLVTAVATLESAAEAAGLDNLRAAPGAAPAPIA